MPLTLHPAKLSRKNAARLYDFFESQSQLGIQLWNKNKRYQFSDNTVFYFPYDVIQRQRKPGKPGYRYEFISDRKVGEGNFGRLYENEGTLDITAHSFTYNQHGYINKRGVSKTRLTKIQRHNENYPVERAEEEFYNAPYHLHMKAPTIAGDSSYLVMEELSEMTLQDIIKYFDLPLALRIEVTKKVSRAIKVQVTDAGKIHRDIKPENILVGLGLPIKVDIVDYAFAINLEYDNPIPAGSWGYMSPEIFNGRPYTPKMDVFSLARSLLWLWNIDENSWDDYDNTENEQEDDETRFMQSSGFYYTDLQTLFTGIEGMDDELQNSIRSTLEGMLHYNDDQRLSLNEAIERFDQLDYEGKQYYTAINKLEEQGPTGRAIISTITRLEKGRNSKWNPYWMNCSRKINLIIDAIHETDNIVQAMRDEDSALYKAVNMQRILPITFFGKCAINKAKSLLTVEQQIPSL